MHTGVACRRIGQAANVCERVSRHKARARARTGGIAEFGGAPARYYTVKAILLINFCLPEVNKSPWDTPIATAELAGRNRPARSATRRSNSLPWVIQKIYLLL